jgi:hypothetical protein
MGSVHRRVWVSSFVCYAKAGASRSPFLLHSGTYVPRHNFQAQHGEHQGILEEVTTRPLSLYVVRLRRAILHPQRGDVYDRNVEEMLKNADMPFQIVRPSSELPGDVADHDTGIDCGWQQGVLFLPPAEPTDGASRFVMRRYIFWTPTNAFRYRMALLNLRFLDFLHFTT